MSSVRIRWIRCSSLVVSRSQLLMMLPSPESMGILGIYFADVHGSGSRDVLGVGAGDGEGMVRWVARRGWR